MIVDNNRNKNVH